MQQTSNCGDSLAVKQPYYPVMNDEADNNKFDLPVRPYRMQLRSLTDLKDIHCVAE